MSWELLIQILILIVAVTASVDKWIETHAKGKWAHEAFRKAERSGDE